MEEPKYKCPYMGFCSTQKRHRKCTDPTCCNGRECGCCWDCCPYCKKVCKEPAEGSEECVAPEED